MVGQMYKDKYALYQLVFYENKPISKCYSVIHKYYSYKLASDKINFNNGIITTRDRKMIETLDYWLAENADLTNKNDFYLYIRLKAATNPEFLEWWNDYYFKL